MATYYVDGALGNDSNAGTSPGGGNAWATLSKVVTTLVDGDIAYVKASAVYSISAALAPTQGTWAGPKRIIGYTSTITDLGRPTIQATAGSFSMFSSGAYGGWCFENFIIDGNNQTSIRGLEFVNYGNVARNCKVMNCTNYGIYAHTEAHSIIGCEVTGCSGQPAVLALYGCPIYGCYIHGNSAGGAILGYLAGIIRSIIQDNTGIGVEVANTGGLVIGCSIYDNSSDGIKMTNFWLMGAILNNIIVSNGGYGLNAPGLAVGVSDPRVDYNAFFNNSSGERNIVLAGPHDISLSGIPFTNAGAGDFTLNNTLGAGAACRGAGFPGMI